MADRFSRIDNSSPLQSKLENEDLNIPRSVFDWTHVHSGQAIIGALTPVFCHETIPNMELDIDLDALLELRNPTTRKLLNGCRVYFHAYFNRCSDLWEGFNNYIDLGRSGNLHLEKPNLKYSITTDVQGVDVVADNNTPMSLMNYMGIPSTAIPSDSLTLSPLRYGVNSAQTYFNNNTGTINSYYKEIGKKPDFIDALPFMAYQRNWRDFYANKNLLQGNKQWFPDNEDHFILSYNAADCFVVDYENENLDEVAKYHFNDRQEAQYFHLTGHYPEKDQTDRFDFNEHTFEPWNPTTAPIDDYPSSYGCAPVLSALKFRQFRGDRFTTALPFPDLIRGNVPTLSQDSDVKFFSDSYGGFNADFYYSLDSESGEPSVGDRFLSMSSKIENFPSGGAGSLKVQSSITLNDIRALEVFTVFKERMARTSGDYNDMIEAQYGFNPRVHNREATYIGGCYQDIVFSSISQTSASTADSPLGSKAGQGISQNSGRIGHFKCPDFGWIQIYMSIVPDTYYTQGLPRQFSRKVQEDNYFPIFNNLAPQAILNKELFISGETSKDNDVFAFEERYQEFKSIPNRVSGLTALGHELAEYDSASVMARRFTTTPKFNSQFLSMVPENIDMDVYSFNDEPPFDFSCIFKITTIAPIPYTTVPGKMDLHA